MTVKELIEELKKHNPDMNVLIESNDYSDYTYKTPITTITTGHPYNESGYSGVDDTELDEVDEAMFDENSDYIGTPVLLINIGVV